MPASATPHFLPLFLLSHFSLLSSSLSQTPPAAMHEPTHDVFSHPETADKEDMEAIFFPQLITFLSAVMFFSEHIPIALGRARCSCFLSQDLSSSSPQNSAAQPAAEAS